MSSTRSIKSPGVFANAALTTIPPVPVAGVSYRDAATGAANVTAGWPFAEKVNSAEFNQLMYLYTSMLGILDTRGVLGWSDAVDYTVPALVYGSDNAFYIALQASGPASAPKDPISTPTYWRPLLAPARTLSVLTAGSGNLIVPAGVFSLDVQGWASGAGGGGVGAAGGIGGGGGGGGGYFRSVIAVTPGQSIAYSVGTAGAAGGQGAAGGNGNPTSFGSFTAQGGIGGRPNDTGNGGAGGTVSGSPQISSGGGSGSASSTVTGGLGGGSPFGGAGGGSAPGPGGAGAFPGGGGAGRGPSNVGTGSAGGAGLIIVQWGV